VSAPAPAVSLRPITAADRPLLLRLYESTRERELALAGFTPEQRAAFVEHQFTAQSLHYEQHYHDTSFDLVLIDGEPAGRLIVGRWESEIRVVDIVLLPERRGRGVGERLMREVIAEAEGRGVKTTIHVEKPSPARRLYERLGFVAVGEQGIHLLMERPPGGAGGEDQEKIAS
jgi:ribosomal protein S18 acetylase RimI-like enzyme